MTAVGILQAGLDRVTDESDRWYQPQYGLAEVGLRRLETFKFEDRAEPDDVMYNRSFFPATDCGGGKLCLAGHMLVDNDHIFVGYQGQTTLDRVIKKDRLRPFLIGELGEGEHAFDAAKTLVGLGARDAYALFHEDNSLLDLWAIAYALTDGQVVPPERAVQHATGKGGFGMDLGQHETILTTPEIIGHLAAWAQDEDNMIDFDYVDEENLENEDADDEGKWPTRWYIATTFFLRGFDQTYWQYKDAYALQERIDAEQAAMAVRQGLADGGATDMLLQG